LPPEINLQLEKQTQQGVLSAIQKGLVTSAHDVADGGLVIALAECCIGTRARMFGLTANMFSALRPDILCFSESQSRFILTTSMDKKNDLERHFGELNIPVHRIGQVGGDVFCFNNWFTIPVADLAEIYYNTLPDLMKASDVH
jgi:phosphoribosylformylglycinamidine synthase subunit PurL